MSLHALRTLAVDTAAALDNEPDAQVWPDLLGEFVQRLVAMAEVEGVDGDDLVDELELHDGRTLVAFAPTEPPVVPGVSDATAAELGAWAQMPGSGFLFGEYGLLPCLAGVAWPLDAFADGTLNAADYLGSPSLGPHVLVQTLVMNEFIFDDEATPVDELSIGDWGRVPRGEGETQWLILSDEYREQAILAAPHLGTEARPLPIFWCDWMDEIGLTYLGGTAREALRTLARRGVEAAVRNGADMMGFAGRELRGVLG